jgi:hypothetical protein
VHIYRWDLDKTYLDTDIESVRGLIRTALESASSKQTLPGAAELIRQLTRHDSSARVHILSGSPKQMRPVIEEKLRLDGVRVDRLTLKDNLGNIRRGRLRAVRGQLGYKLPKLLQERAGLGAVVRETLFGDDSEVDALVYTVYADVVAGRIASDELERILEAGGAYRDSVEAALDAASQLERSDAIEDIFINVTKGLPLSTFALLGPGVTPVFSWLQAALALYQRGRLDLGGLRKVISGCTKVESLNEFHLFGLVQDALRRRLINRATLSRIAADPDHILPFTSSRRDALHNLKIPDRTTRKASYIGFLRACP